jgi:hypothetical protein
VEGARKTIKGKVAVADGVADSRRMPGKCCFAEILGCPGTHTLWSCKAFAKLAPEDRDRIILDNKMCAFCLLHREDGVCYGERHRQEALMH